MEHLKNILLRVFVGGLPLALTSCSTPPDILERSQAQVELYDKAAEAQKIYADAINSYQQDIDRLELVLKARETKKFDFVAEASADSKKVAAELKCQTESLAISKLAHSSIDRFLRAGDKSQCLDNADESAEKIKNAIAKLQENSK